MNGLLSSSSTSRVSDVRILMDIGNVSSIIVLGVSDLDCGGGGVSFRERLLVAARVAAVVSMTCLVRLVVKCFMCKYVCIPHFLKDICYSIIEASHEQVINLLKSMLNWMLQALKSVFKKDGVVTAANASKICAMVRSW